MGNKDSKPSISIGYEECLKRVSPAELARIKEAFKRSAPSAGSTISKSAFIQDVLSETVPDAVADWIFTACGGTTKGIGFKELLCALVLLSKGTQEEKIRFLWTIYCNDSGTHIIKMDFQRQLAAEAVYRNNSILAGQKLSDPQAIFNRYQVSLFGQADRVIYEQFKQWIITHKDATVLSHWLLLDSCVFLSSELETPTFYQSLAGVTHLEEQDIEDLEKMFWNLKATSVTGQLDMETFSALISPPVPRQALRGVFLAFDENRDGHIDFKELCCGVSAACRGPSVERTKFCFKIFDTDSDGVLNTEEVRQTVEVLLLVAKESNNVAFKSMQSSQVLAELHDRTPNQDVHSVDFHLTQEDFLMWSVESALNLVQPFLDLLFEACHIVLGLRPQCRHLEQEIVRGWLNRENKRGLKVGQFWYLIDSAWWQTWLTYTQTASSGSCFCKNGTNYGGAVGRIGHTVDEAMICDESFTSNSTESTVGDTSSLGSTSSGISFGRQGPPGPIDNSNLISPPVNKTAKALTGEGGKLKKNIALVQHRDIELVPESLWKFLLMKYGGNIALPRQVIQPPNSPTFELELYPLNLRILRHHNPASGMGAPTPTATWGGYGALTSGTYTSFSSVSTTLQVPKKYLAYTAAFSKLATVKQVSEFLCGSLKLKMEDVRLWHITGTPEVTSLLEDENASLCDIEINDNDQILLEVRNKDLTWPEEVYSLVQPHQMTSQNLRRQSSLQVASPHALGATGLHNLGNTCFMNAALQVLFNTQPLTQYFRQNMHLFEVNTTNKLGTKGQVALRYGELLKEVWTASSRSIAPLKLRFCVSKHAQQFAGGGQHDSQELLAWLLDALHEDLNRVTEKPYAELKDSNGRPDAVVAAEAWSQYHARNQSIIVDLFYGQLKSKVNCLTCRNESVRFDPFSLLSLPLPMENFTYCEVLVVLLDGSVPAKYGLRANSDCKYWDLKHQLAPLCGLEADKMLICEVANSQIRTILPNELKIKPSSAAELYCYEIPTLDHLSRLRRGSETASQFEKGLKDIQRKQAAALKEQNQLTVVSSTTNLSGSSDDVFLDQSASDTTKVCVCGQRRARKKPDPVTSSTSAGRQSDLTEPKAISTTNLLSNGPSNVLDATPADDLPLCSFCGGILEPSADDLDDREADAIESVPMTAAGHLAATATIGTSYLVAVHRNMCRQDVYFLSHHKARPSLFGVPLLIPCFEGITNKELYCSVWIQVSRLLSPLPSSPDQVNHATDCDDSLGYDFPFTLKAVSEGGQSCCLCPWPRFCRGCEIPCNDESLFEGFLTKLLSIHGTTNFASSAQSTPCAKRKQSRLSDLINISAINIAIDWEPTALHLRYQSTREKVWREDPSLAICRKQQTDPIDLDYCLRAFTAEEKLEHLYFCSHCKSKQPATKKLQIWKLPPVLIVHLKRFNFLNNKWIKSNKVVNFPFAEFDPTPYLASVPQETILRHRELVGGTDSGGAHNLRNLDCSEEINEFDRENAINSTNMDAVEEGEGDSQALCADGAAASAAAGSSQSFGSGREHNKAKRNSLIGGVAVRREANRRKRLVSTSLAKTPVIDGEFTDFHDHKLKEGEDPFDLKYNLYAVVSHTGMLNGGHYVAYAANPTVNKWFCYNDSSCRELCNKPNFDPSTAYLLFYERKSLDYVTYLPSVEEKATANGLPLGLDLEQDESENDLRKMCVIA